MQNIRKDAFLGPISVIVVTYNRLEYLKLTIQSILNQTYSDIELIIVGDGHQKDVANYVAAHPDKRVSYYYVEHCGYPAKARNFALEKAKATFVSFCDDDDLWVETKLEKQARMFINDPNLDMSFTQRKIINSNSILIANYKVPKLPLEISYHNLLKSNFITYSSVMIRRDILSKTGLFPDDIKYKALEDYHLWLRIAYFGRIAVLNEPLVLYRVHNNNITTRFSVGAYRSLFILSDVFKTCKTGTQEKIKAYFMRGLKMIFYKIQGR